MMTMEMLVCALGLLMCLYAMQAEILRAGVHISRNANVFATWRIAKSVPAPEWHLYAWRRLTVFLAIMFAVFLVLLAGRWVLGWFR